MCSSLSTAEPAVLDIEACSAFWRTGGTRQPNSYTNRPARCCHAMQAARLTNDALARFEDRLGRGCEYMGPRSMPAKMSMLCCCAMWHSAADCAGAKCTCISERG